LRHGRCARDQVASGERLYAARARLPEIIWRSAGWGLVFCIVFSVASACSGLKVGQVMETAIPIWILAIGLARLYARRSSLLENVIMTGIGGVAGSVVAGAVRRRNAALRGHLRNQRLARDPGARVRAVSKS